MRKLIAIGFAAGLLFVASAWSIGWFVQARNLRQWVATGIAAADPTYGTITADSVSVSGFPLKMSVTLTNPTLTLRMQPLLTAMHKRSMAAAGSSAGVLTTPEYPESVLQMTANGTVTITLSALSDELHMHKAGGSRTQLTQPGIEPLVLATEYNGDSGCHIKLEHNLSDLLHSMWDMRRVLTSLPALEHLRALRCEQPGSITTDIASGQVAASVGASVLEVTNAPSGGMHRLALYIQMKGYEILPAGDAAMSRLRKAVTPAGEIFSPVAMSLYGKQTLLLDMAAELPLDLQLDGSKPLRAQIRKLAYTSAANSTEGSALFSFFPQGSERQGEASLHFTSSFTPRQTDIARAGLGELLRDASTPPQFAAIVNRDQAKIEDAFFNALPNITMLGQITQRIALTYRIDAAKKSGNVDVTAFELSTSDYGLIGKGSGSMAEGLPLPAAKAELACKNCIAMIDVLAGYLTRVEAAAVLMNPAYAGTIAWTPQQLLGIKQLLQNVGVAANAADLQFTVETQAGAVNINGKTLAELLQLAQQYLMPTPPPIQR